LLRRNDTTGMDQKHAVADAANGFARSVFRQMISEFCALCCKVGLGPAGWHDGIFSISE
jgi:hypothetical protein